jgi:hypothetical protein
MDMECLERVKRDQTTADRSANPQKYADTEEMLMDLEYLERNLLQFRLTNKNGRYAEMLTVRERRTKIRSNAALIIQRATRRYLEKIHRRPWLEYRRVKASNIHELAGFSEHGASSADIPLRYLSFQIASSAPLELRVPRPRKAVVGIPGLAGHLGVRGLREGAPGKTLKPQTLTEALLSGTQGICTPPTTPGEPGGLMMMQATLSLPLSASSLKSAVTKRERGRGRERETRGSARGVEAPLYKINPYNGGGAVSCGDTSTETATMRSGATGDTNTEPSESGKYSRGRGVGEPNFCLLRPGSPRGLTVATLVHHSPLNPSGVVAGVRLRASAGGGGDREEGAGSEVREEGGESEAVPWAPPWRQTTAEFVNQFVPSTCNSSSLSRTHAALTSNNSPPTAVSSRYSAGQLPPIMLSPQQCKSMGRTTFLGLRHGPSSPQPQPPAGERGGQMEGGQGPREKRALNRERDVLHLLIAHGTADCRKVFAAQSHKHKQTNTQTHTYLLTYAHIGICSTVTQTHKHKHKHKKHIHTCICTYRHLQHSHTHTLTHTHTHTQRERERERERESARARARERETNTQTQTHKHNIQTYIHMHIQVSAAQSHKHKHTNTQRHTYIHAYAHIGICNTVTPLWVVERLCTATCQGSH